MHDRIVAITKTLALIAELKERFAVEQNKGSCAPLLYTGVIRSEIIGEISPVVENYFGAPIKVAGQNAFLKNLYDDLAKAVGGMRKEQTFFRKDVSPGIILYCAFWPWGSDPARTSVRIGLLCSSDEVERQMSEALVGCFQ